MTTTAFDGRSYAENPLVRIDNGEVASAKPRRSFLLFRKCGAVGDARGVRRMGFVAAAVAMAGGMAMADAGALSDTLQAVTGSTVSLAPGGVATQGEFKVLSPEGAVLMHAWNRGLVGDYGGAPDYGLKLDGTTITAANADGKTTVTFSGGTAAARDFLFNGDNLVFDGGVFTNELSFAVASNSAAAKSEVAMTVKGGARVDLLTRYVNVARGVPGHRTTFNIENGRVNLSHSGSAGIAPFCHYFGYGAGSTCIVEVAEKGYLFNPPYTSFTYPADHPEAAAAGKTLSAFGNPIYLGNSGGTGIINVRGGTAQVQSGLYVNGAGSGMNLYSGRILAAVNGSYIFYAGTLNLMGGTSEIRMLTIGQGGAAELNISGGTHYVNGSPEAYRGLTLCGTSDSKSRATVNLTGGTFYTKRLSPNYDDNKRCNQATGGLGWIRLFADGGTVVGYFVQQDKPEKREFISGLDEAILGAKGLTVSTTCKAITTTVVDSPRILGTTQNFENAVDAATGEEVEGRLIIGGTGWFVYASPASRHAATEVVGGTLLISNGCDVAAQKLVVAGGELALTNVYNSVTVKDLVIGRDVVAGTITFDATSALTVTNSIAIDALAVKWAGAGDLDPGVVYDVLRVKGDKTVELGVWTQTAAVTAGLPAGKTGSFTAAYDSGTGYTTLKVQAVDAPPTKELTWTGATDGKWNAAANWSPSTTAPDRYSNLTFPAAGANKLIAIELGAAANNLTFDSAEGYRVAGDQLALAGADPASMKTITVSSGAHEIASDVKNIGSNAVTVADGAKLTLSGVQLNTGLVKDGDGVLALSSADESGTSGTFTVADGHLVATAQALSKYSGGTIIPQADAATTLTIVNEEEGFVTVPKLNLAGTDSVNQLVDFCITGNVAMTRYTLGKTKIAKRGSGTLRLNIPGGGSIMDDSRNGAPSVRTLDANGRLGAGSTFAANFELIEGGMEVVGDPAQGVFSAGGGTSRGFNLGGRLAGSTVTNVSLTLDHVSFSPTYFYVGGADVNNAIRRVGLKLRNGAVVGNVLGYMYGEPQVGNNTTAPAKLYITAEGGSTVQGDGVEGNYCQTEGAVAYWDFSGGSVLNVRRLSLIRGLCEFNFRGSTLQGPAQYGIQGTNYVQEPLVKIGTIEGNFLSDKMRASLNFSEGAELSCGGIDWRIYSGTPLLQFKFDGAKWTFGNAGEVEVVVRSQRKECVKVLTEGAGLEFAVTNANQTVSFCKDVIGAGGVRKTGAGKLVFGPVKICTDIVSSGSYTIGSCTTNTLIGADGYSVAMTGAVEVAEGTLGVKAGAADPALARFTVAAGATLDLDGATHVFKSVGGAGMIANGTLSDTVIALNPAGTGVLTLAEGATLAGRTKLDFGYTVENPMTRPYPSNLLVARYLGAAPTCSWKLAGTGLDGMRLDVVVANGEVRASVALSGMMVILR